MMENASSATPVDCIVTPFSVATYEILLRNEGTAYAVADGWSIAWSAKFNGWQVFYRTIDANYRLGVARDQNDRRVLFFSTFKRAWTWLHELTPEDIHDIVVRSV